MKKYGCKRSLNFIFIIVAVLTITIGYSVMNRELTITGNSEVKSNSWDIHFENVVVKEGSVTAIKVPTIDAEKDGIDFSVSLNLPGDYYSFTVDVVNAGSMDGMVDTITKTPELTDAQKKYLNYKIEYENGEVITSKQLVKKESFVRVKVIVEYRKDITETDLPTVDNTLNLGFTINYVQSDETGSVVENNGKLLSANGSLDAIGTIVTIGNQQFYTIGTEGNNVKLFSMYNLHVGNSILDETNTITPLVNPTGIQDRTAIGSDYTDTGDYELPWIGLTTFAEADYWEFDISSYPEYVYSSKNSLMYTYIENYKNYIEGLGVPVVEARLISNEELTSEQIGCSTVDQTCEDAPEWVYSTSYWTGTADNVIDVWGVFNDAIFIRSNMYWTDTYGVRPVIVISKSLF